MYLQIWKALIAMGYLFTVTWITAFVMVIVHDRVPDMKKYPPLPDIFLDNVPYIPWAFHMCELTGTVLCFVWLAVLVFHKHRFILLRRFFALSGTVFLLRCITMIITSLSVPGIHLECKPRQKPAYLDGMCGWDDDISTTFVLFNMYQLNFHFYFFLREFKTFKINDVTFRLHLSPIKVYFNMLY